MSEDSGLTTLDELHREYLQAEAHVISMKAVGAAVKVVYQAIKARDEAKRAFYGALDAAAARLGGAQ